MATGRNRSVPFPCEQSVGYNEVVWLLQTKPTPANTSKLIPSGIGETNTLNLI